MSNWDYRSPEPGNGCARGMLIALGIELAVALLLYWLFRGAL
jgi:hypothetical protein